MENLYNVNGLIFWSEEEIRLREMLKNHFVAAVSNNLKTQNRGFEIIQVEAPLLTPHEFINSNYSGRDTFGLDEENEMATHCQFVLRPETTMGTYKAIEHLLSNYNERKVKLPACVWQHGKSFRREQDQPTKFMRLKEFYQLEFQIAYSPTTANDYSISLIPAVQQAISEMIGPCHVEASDRLPDYSEITVDIICDKTKMEVCSISKRKDFPLAKILEVAIGTDRCVFNFLNKGQQ
jgi:glycyl-tRNA synthetase